VREIIIEEVAVAQVVPAFLLSGASNPQTNPNESGGAVFLKGLKCVWEDHTICMFMIRENSSIVLCLFPLRKLFVRGNFPIMGHV